VVQAVRAVPANQSPSSPRPPRQYAIKIINQAHLVAEKKTKYAMIERDALVRLNAPLNNTAMASPSNPSAARGHRRGLSGSSNNGGGTNGPRKNRSSASLNQSTQSANYPSQHHHASLPSSRRDSTVDRLSIVTTLSDSTSSGGASGSTNFGSSAPLSPTLISSLAGRRPSRSADPPEMVPERSEEGHSEVLARSRPPSPVREDSREHVLDAAGATTTPPKTRTTGAGQNRENGGADGEHAATYSPPETPIPAGRQIAPDPPSTPNASSEHNAGQVGQAERQTQSATAVEKRPARRSNEDRELVPRSRRASKAPSDRSSRSVGARSHPGIIRLFSTFNDATSLCELSSLWRGLRAC
jgi:3-phosphoinositide dependent protein kinase-1